MKDNKPILFINSASTNNYFQQEQFVFDSRLKNKRKIQENKIKTEEVTEVNEPIEDTDIDNTIQEVVDYELEKPNIKEEEGFEEEVIIAQPNTTEEASEVVNEEPAEVVIEKPFANKIRLLTRRAQLNRYVYVGIITSDGEIEGYFKDSNANQITLEFDDQEMNILIDEIEDIRIIRV